jgi:copper chaperone NosL
MMTWRAVGLTLLLLTACGPKEEARIPPPAPLSAAAIGHFCGMAVLEHAGPKAQAWVAGLDQPYWFTSVRDAVAFTLLPEEPKAIAALYVTDMTKAAGWDKPGPWIEAHRAVYVIGSSQRGGMGGDEAVPFSDPAAAAAFARQYGGTVVRFEQIPRDYVLEGR